MWIRVALCVALCGSLHGQQAPPLIVTNAPGSFDPTCVDKMANCWDMPQSSCEAPYKEWAKENCKNRCGICTNGPTTPKPECKDKLPDCEAYDKSVCTNPDYTKWVGENCRYYCRMCTPDELARIDSMTTTIPPEKCKDKVDCRAYGANACSDTFKAWSKDNCMSYCGFCKSLPTPPPACIDHIPNCNAYDKDTCTNPNYRLWAEDNCKKFCGLCPGGANAGSGTGAVPTRSGPAIPVPISGRDVPVISYVPPTPPKPGKRHVNAPPLRRQFEASHHHSGETNPCFDSNSSECQSGTVDKNKGESTTSSFTDIVGKDFPGSEFKPRPTPGKGWDSKPSTEKPVQQSTSDPTNSGTKSTETVTETTMTTNNGLPSTTKMIKPPLISNEPTMKTVESTTQSTTTSSTTSSSSPASETSASAAPITSSPSMPTESTITPSSSSLTSSTPSSTTSDSIASSPQPGTTAPPATLSTSTEPIIPKTNATTSSATSGTVTSVGASTEAPTTSSQTESTTEMTTSESTASAATNSSQGTIKPTQAPPIVTSTDVTSQSTQPSAQPSLITSGTTGAPPAVSSSTLSMAKSTLTTDKVPPTATTPPLRTTGPPATGTLSTDQVPPLATTAPPKSTGPPPTLAPDTTSTSTTTPPPKSTGPPPTLAPVTTTTASTTPPPLATSPSTQPGPTTTELPCEDTVDNCIQYGPLICNNAEYIPWATAHCRRFCKFCTPVTVTPFVCKNKKANCNQYDSGDLCTAIAYYGWSRENCYAYCGFPPCDKVTTPMSPSV